MIGPDVGTFLDRIYINTFSTLAVGKVRYGIMLREDGFVMDDGTTARLMVDHWVMSTTTANAGKVMQHLEFCHQVLWPELDVQMVSVTEQWSQYAVAGPRSRELLQQFLGDAADPWRADAFRCAPGQLYLQASRQCQFRRGRDGRITGRWDSCGHKGEDQAESTPQEIRLPRLPPRADHGRRGDG